MWALGDYPAVATEVIAALGPVVVEAAGITAGQRVLDVAAGSGNAAIPAARTGAQVVASDLTPELLEVGRAAADAEGLDLAWEQADAEALPYADDEFDAVISVVGVMFAPHHQAAADELVRVCRPRRDHRTDQLDAGGLHRPAVRHHEAVRRAAPGRRTATAAVGQSRARHRAARRPGHGPADRAPLAHRGPVPRTPASFRDFFKACYGPTIAAYKFIADDADKVAALDQDLLDLAARHLDADTRTMEWEYLLVTAHKA